MDCFELNGPPEFFSLCSYLLTKDNRIRTTSYFLSNYIKIFTKTVTAAICYCFRPYKESVLVWNEQLWKLKRKKLTQIIPKLYHITESVLLSQCFKGTWLRRPTAVWLMIWKLLRGHRPHKESQHLYVVGSHTCVPALNYQHHSSLAATCSIEHVASAAKMTVMFAYLNSEILYINTGILKPYTKK